MLERPYWADRLRDQRSGRVVFLAHCLLNENTRYLGGAQRGGAVTEVVQPFLDRGVGIVQLPCPEQRAWGGVLKRRLLRLYGSEGTFLFRFRRVLLPLALGYTKLVYRRLARETADQIQDYQRSGFQVLGLIGVDDSPSCGVARGLDVQKAVEALGRLDPNRATVQGANAIIRASVIPGRGLFLELLKGELESRGLRIPIGAHDLLGELEGRHSSADVHGMLGARS